MKNIPDLKLSKKGYELLEMYKLMVDQGYDNNLFNIKKFKEFLKNIFLENKVKSVLDYGSGRSNWFDNKFDNTNNQTAIEYFGLNKVFQYEPTIINTKKEVAECVLCFDVLEHFFLSDLKNVISDLYYHSTKIVVLQVACYEAKAKLTNGENAHITVRNPFWWKGFIDAVSSNFEKTQTVLICSTEFNKASVFKKWSLNEWNESETYKVDL